MATMQNFLAHLQQELAQKKSLVISVKIIPKSAKNELVGLIGEDILKIRIAAAPEQNKANEQLCRFLADLFGTTKDGIKILSGQTSQRKLIRININ